MCEACIRETHYRMLMGESIAIFRNRANNVCNVTLRHVIKTTVAMEKH
jgi:hypothetical protein